MSLDQSSNPYAKEGGEGEEELETNRIIIRMRPLLPSFPRALGQTLILCELYKLVSKGQIAAADRRQVSLKLETLIARRARD